MTEICSNDYHDFVIKENKLIGEFEQMYTKSKVIPWHQDKQNNQLDIRTTIELLKEYKPFDRIYDLGCGLGYFLKHLKDNVGSAQCSGYGYDVSQTCCLQAKKLFLDLDFMYLDLRDDDSSDTKLLTNSTIHGKNLYAIRGTLWYVFPKMGNVVRTITKMTRKDDYLLVSQNFPPLKNDFVGKDIIPNASAIIEWFYDYFDVLKSIWMQDHVSDGNDNWFIGLFKRR